MYIVWYDQYGGQNHIRKLTDSLYSVIVLFYLFNEDIANLLDLFPMKFHLNIFENRMISIPICI